MTLAAPTAGYNAAADALLNRADAGTGPGLLRIYTGSQPSVNAAPSGTLLVEIELADPAFDPATSGGSKTLNDPDPADGVANGNAGWFRIVDSAGTTVLDGSVSGPDGGGDLELVNVSIAEGQPVDLASGTLSVGPPA